AVVLAAPVDWPDCGSAGSSDAFVRSGDGILAGLADIASEAIVSGALRPAVWPQVVTTGNSNRSKLLMAEVINLPLAIPGVNITYLLAKPELRSCSECEHPTLTSNLTRT